MIKVSPKNMRYTIGVLALFAALALPGNVHAANDGKTGGAPIITLKLWSDSSEQEQYAFLAGFVSLLELEKEWQGQKGILPLKQSMVGSWGMGMDGMSLKAIRGIVNNYIANNPNEKDKLVLEVLWRECVQPKIKEAAPAAEKDTPKRVRRAIESQKQEKTL